MSEVTRRSVQGLAALGILATVVALMRILIDHPLEGGLRLAWPEPSVSSFRFTALTCGALVGASLAVSGVLLQALLRNPLASPFVLGLSSGAGLGVTTAMYLGYLAGWSGLRSGHNIGPAIVGAMAALAIVYGLGQRRGWLDPVSLLLVGVVVSAVGGALTMFLQQLVPMGLHAEMARWLFGRIPQAVPEATLIILALMTAAGTGVSMWMGRAIDVAALSEDEARSVGLSIGSLRTAMFLIAGALAAASVAIAGPIAFVGIIAPHAARLVLGPRHRVLVLGAALCGATVVVGADVASQAIPLSTGRMPVGVFTALLGGPLFIWLLRSGRGWS